MSRAYKTEAIILARRNIGEADRLLTIFSKHYGKLRVVAKGVRRVTSRKRGSLELFNCVSLLIVRGKTFDVVTEVETKNNFSAWRGELLKVGVAYHLAEVVAKLTREGQEAGRVFELLKKAHEELGNINFWQLHSFIIDFKKEVLIELGFLTREIRKKDLDSYIEELSQSHLHTKRFLRSLS